MPPPLRLAVALATLGLAATALRIDLPATADPAAAALAEQRGLADRAHDAVLARKYQDAVPLLERLRARSPDDHIIQRDLAVAYGALNRPADEAAAWDAYMRVAPTPDEACPVVGLAYERAGDRAHAIDALKRCVAAIPDDGDQYYALGTAYERAQQIEQAHAVLAEGVSKLPRHAGLRTALAFNALHRGANAEALEQARAAMDLAPGDADPLLAAGIAETRLGKPRDARPLLERAVAVRPNDSDIHFALGLLDEQDGRLADARREYERALEITPENADARHRLDGLGK